MSPAGKLAASEGFGGESERRKRLGQFFTGTGLGRILGALSRADEARSIVDPMAGSGDLLAACLELGARPQTMGAMEIDPVAFRTCKERLPSVSCVLGSAFDAGVVAALPRREWDLVVANPPYVRYQSIAKGAGKHVKLPSAVEIRNALIDAIGEMTALDDEDKELFRALARGYSGLADLAVPSWILCASMVSVGGRLALVVPESWLSRDYASVVQYLLLRWFRIEHIVEDEHAAWFENAQVKTTLLVARRIVRRESAFDWGETEMFSRIRVSGKAAGASGPIARLFPDSPNPESDFAAMVRQALDKGSVLDQELLKAFPTQIPSVSEGLMAACSKFKWLQTVGETMAKPGRACRPPAALEEWLARGKGASLVPLDSIGICVGQGLRTGANSFFYATAVSEKDGEVLLSLNGVPGIKEARVPSSCVRPALRRQSDLPDGFMVSAGDLVGRVLDLRNTALPEDIVAAGDIAKKRYSPMPEGLASLVRMAALADFGDGTAHKRIYELSAVAPNARKGNPEKGQAPRFWYMLPDFAPRHAPDLLVPRVNGNSPKAWLVENRDALVDANFATIRVGDGSSFPDKHALLVLLNTSWCKAVLESSASVMGGGALKVEATHLSRMPVPKLGKEKWLRLSEIGQRLAMDGSGLNEANALVASALLGRKARKDEIAALDRLAEDGSERRKKHKQKKGA